MTSILKFSGAILGAELAVHFSRLVLHRDAEPRMAGSRDPAQGERTLVSRFYFLSRWKEVEGLEGLGEAPTHAPAVPNFKQV